MATLALEQIKEDDVRTLVRHPDPDKRASAAIRICRTIRTGILSEYERDFAHRLIDYMAEDAVALVRRALAITLRNSPELPRSTARKLARDIDNIALPIISNSPVFTDDDLIEVIRSKAASKIMAIAKRSSVSGPIVKAIVRYGDSRAVAEVAANDGALIDEETAGQILDVYHDDDLIKEAFIARRDLPTRIMEKLITIISEESALVLNKRHDIPVEVAVDIASRTRERATINIIDVDMPQRELGLLIERLFEEGRLTPSLILRATGLGHMQFLTQSLATLSRIKPFKAALMVHDGGPFGLKVLCERAGFDDNTTRLIRAASAIYRDLELSGIEYDAAYFQSLMIERMLTLPFNISEEDQDWFLERLDSLPSNLAA